MIGRERLTTLMELAMAGPIKLSKSYDTRDDAAIGGFKRVLLNSVQWKTQEFGFWVILQVVKAGGKSVPKYFYTEPEGGGSTGVTLTLPQGLMVRAHCHTHPHSVSTGDFGADDKASYQDLQKVRPGVVFYLLNPYQEVRLAVDEKQFLAGTSVKWSSTVTP